MRIKTNSALGTIMVFIVFFSIFFLFHSLINGLFGVDDPYYHAKHAWLMTETGNYDLVKPWLEFHFFNYAPSDPWWGFHVILSFLIKALGPFWGTKILASVLSALGFATFFLVIRGLGVKKPIVWTFLYFASSSLLLVRLIYERPYLASFSALPLAFYFIHKRRFFYLFVLSAAYALFYQMAPFIIFVAVSYIVSGYIAERKLDFAPFISTAGGILLGIALHPRSLNYVYSIFIHFWQIFFLKIQGVDLKIGAELQTLDIATFIKYSFVAISVYLVANVLFFALSLWKSENNRTLVNFLFIYSSFWFIISLLVPRGADYWLPFAWIFAALIIKEFQSRKEYELFIRRLKSVLDARILAFFMVCVLILLLAYNLVSLYGNISERNKKTDDNEFKEANEWLIDNTPENSIVFYNDWGYWPMMFFYNSHNHYIAGVDPTHLYEYDPKTYWVWRNIGQDGIFCEGQACPNYSPKKNLKSIKYAFRDYFHADYLLMANDKNLPLFKILSDSGHDYKKVFENDKLVIYRILW
jgi:hypothetical protein